MRRRLAGAIVVFVLFAAAPSPALAAVFVVTSTLDFADPDLTDGECGVRRDDGVFLCSLRAAIQEANVQPGAPHQIILQAERYRLLIAGRGEDAGALGDLDIWQHVQITGEFPPPVLCSARAGSGRPIEIPASGIWRDVPRLLAGCRLRGVVGSDTGERGTILDAARLDRAFDVHSGGVLELQGAAVIHGNPQGTLTEVTHGGGIRSNGRVLLVDVAVRGNISGIGGGIFSEGELSLTETAVLSNEAAAETASIVGCGGGVASTGLLRMQASLVGNNRAAGDGGGICAEPHANNPVLSGGDAPVDIRQSVIWRNRAGGGGGGISLTNESATTVLPFAAGISESVVMLNTALARGGGIELRRSPGFDHALAVFESYIVGNSAAGIRRTRATERDRGGDGGGLFLGAAAGIALSAIRGNTAFGNGGGAYLELEEGSTPERSRAELLFSEVALNSAGGDGGGIWSRGISTRLENSTVSGNRADRRGGGLHFTAQAAARPELATEFVTLAANEAPEGAALFAAQTDRHIFRTIVAGGGGSPNCTVSDSPMAADQTIEDQDTCGFLTAFVMVDPKLGPLQNNGGPTRTHALLDESPAIDLIPCPDEDLMDQRLVTRPQNVLCDVGAYERELFPSWAIDCCFHLFVDLLGASSTMRATSAEFQLAMLELKDPTGIQLGESLVQQSTSLAGVLRQVSEAEDAGEARAFLEHASMLADGIGDTLEEVDACCAATIPGLTERLHGALADLRAALAAALAGADRGVVLLEIESLLEAVEGAQLSTGLKNSLSNRLTDARDALADGDVAAAIAHVTAFIDHAAAAGNASRHQTAPLSSAAEEIRQRLQALLATP